jgi:hypothetical protein
VTAGTWDDNPASRQLFFLCRSSEGDGDGDGGGGGVLGVFLWLFFLGALFGGLYWAYRKYGAPVELMTQVKDALRRRAGVTPALATTTATDPTAYSSYSAPVVAPIVSGPGGSA